MKSIILNNGIEMPQQGLGTFLIPNKKLTDVIGEAYRLGYRQFDTAWKYRNEREIAEALKANGID
jgi:diketogulonate reductase-like aldo/keto reductase